MAENTTITITRAEAAKKFEAFRKAKIARDKAERELKELSPWILAYCDELGVKYAEAGGCAVSIVERISRSIDTKRLRDEHPEIAAQYERETYSRFPKVK